MPDYTILLDRYEGKRCLSPFPKRVHKLGFSRLAKSLFINREDRRNIFRFFVSDCHHRTGMTR